MRRIEHHMGSAEAAIKALKIPHVQVHYTEYLQQQQAVAQRLGEFFGIDLSVEDLNVHPDLNHGTLRGRITGLTRLFFTKLPRRPIRAATDAELSHSLETTWPPCRCSAS